MEIWNYSVSFNDFAKRHYIKSFKKKYKSNWDKTQDDIVDICKRIDNMLQSGRVDGPISTAGVHKLVKLSFAVEGTNTSPKGSGNRCILHINEEDKTVEVLLVYSKNDIGPPNETQKWKNVIKQNLPEIAQIYEGL